jgi:ABC-type Mn2+/Zn2+ transport system permease subunit
MQWPNLWYILATLLSVHLRFTVLITPLVSFGHSVVCPSSIYRFDYPIGIFWLLCCLSIFNLPFWLPLWYHMATQLSVHLKLTVLINPLVSFGHSIVCPSLIYRFDYSFGIFCPFCFLSIFYLPFLFKRFERWNDFLKTIDLIIYYSDYGDVVKILNTNCKFERMKKSLKIPKG